MWSPSGHRWPGDKVHTDPVAESGSIEYEMGYGADEFGKVLNGNFTGERSDYSCETLSRHHWRITEQGSSLRIEIKVVEKPPRKIGLFALPVLQVRFQMVDTAAELQARFFERFHKYFHKGGG